MEPSDAEIGLLNTTQLMCALLTAARNTGNSTVHAIVENSYLVLDNRVR